MEKNAGYVIRESVLFDNKRGFAIAEHGNPKVPAPFGTFCPKVARPSTSLFAYMGGVIILVGGNPSTFTGGSRL